MIRKNVYWNHIWKKDNKAQKYLKKNWLFHNVIQTDGVGVCILYDKVSHAIQEKKNTVRKNKGKNKLNNTNDDLDKIDPSDRYIDPDFTLINPHFTDDELIVGGDPNKGDIIHLYSDRSGPKGESIDRKMFRYTNCQRNFETKKDI